MLDPTLPKDQSELTVMPARVEVVLADEDISPLSLVLPPIDDLSEMEQLRDANFSLKALVAREDTRATPVYRKELEALKARGAGAETSPTYLNRLANLAWAAGDSQSELRYLSEASEYSSINFFKHRISSNLMEQGKMEAAEALLNDPGLSNDSHTFLKIAYFHTRRLDLFRASAAVARAVELEPIDFGARLFEGALRLLEGKFEKAISSFRIAEEARPDSSSLYCNMAIAYVGLNRYEKAMTSLKRAVALNPINVSAVTLLADIASKRAQDHEAIPSLRLYLQFEQSDANVWARFSRSLLSIGQLDESISALKRQGSLNPIEPSVWNNLGVAYHRKGDTKRAAESYKKAIELDQEKQGRSFFLAARNFALMLEGSGRPKDLLKFTSLVLNEHYVRRSLTEREHAELVMLKIHAELRSSNPITGVESSETLLRDEESSDLLKLWLVIGLLSWYPINGNFERAVELVRQHEKWIDKFSVHDQDLRIQLINNIAFTLADVGRLEEATHFISMISHRVHKDSYPTATLGLIQMRKGNVDRGTLLYEEAGRLSFSVVDKTRIKQKLWVELARAQIGSGDYRRAQINLSRAASTKGGEAGLVKLSQNMLRQLQLN